jgi:hypothetical protein
MSRQSWTIYSETSQHNIIHSAEHSRLQHEAWLLSKAQPQLCNYWVTRRLSTFIGCIEKNGFLLAAFVVMKRPEGPLLKCCSVTSRGFGHTERGRLLKSFYIFFLLTESCGYGLGKDKEGSWGCWGQIDDSLTKEIWKKGMHFHIFPKETIKITYNIMLLCTCQPCLWD